MARVTDVVMVIFLICNVIDNLRLVFGRHILQSLKRIYPTASPLVKQDGQTVESLGADKL